MEEKKYYDVHLKRKIYWWNGEKLCNVRKVSGTLSTLHLEVVNGQSYVVSPFTFPDKYGCDSVEGLIFPIKESVEWVNEFKVKQNALPKTKKEKDLDKFLDVYRDYCRSDDEKSWVLKLLRWIFK